MLHRVFVFGLVLYFCGCGQQPEATHKATTDHSNDLSISKIRRISILPQNPRTSSSLKAVVLFRGKDPERVSYQWLRNEQAILGASAPVLGKENLHKGDFISVSVEVHRPGGSGDERTSDVVIIGNSPPAATFAGIEPGEPSSSDTLRAVGAGSDDDDDAVSFVYQWIVNDETLVGQDEQFLASKHFRRGDQVRVAITAYDGEEYGSTISSAPVVIKNSPPKIVSTPPASADNGLFRYAVQTEDVDGDPLHFSLEGDPPAGMKIDGETGLVTWQVVVAEKEVTYDYKVVAEDPEGYKSIQRITLQYKPDA